MGQIGSFVQNTISKIIVYMTQKNFPLVVQEIILLFHEFDKLNDFKKTDQEKENFENSRNLSE